MMWLQLPLRGGVVQWVVPLTCNRSVVSSNPIKGSVVSLSKKLITHCLVLVCFRNIFEHDLHTKMTTSYKSSYFICIYVLQKDSLTLSQCMKLTLWSRSFDFYIHIKSSVYIAFLGF